MEMNESSANMNEASSPHNNRSGACPRTTFTVRQSSSHICHIWYKSKSGFHQTEKKKKKKGSEMVRTKMTQWTHQNHNSPNSAFGDSIFFKIKAPPLSGKSSGYMSLHCWCNMKRCSHQTVKIGAQTGPTKTLAMYLQDHIHRTVS